MDQTTRTDERVMALLGPQVESLGYELVHVELQTHRAKILRLFIDRIDASAGAIGIEDCVKVTRALEEPLEEATEIDAIFPGGYELEVSSPGVDRPLRKPKDFERFKGREIRVHVFRPLTDEELDNAAYRAKNPKQKNFVGRLEGLAGDRIRLALDSKRIAIPLSLVSKANLEPNWDFKAGEKR